MPKITSSYIQGLSQDRAISKNDNKHITFGLNIDLSSFDNPEDVGIVTNHSGTKFYWRLPDLQPVYKIELSGTLGNGSIGIDTDTSLITVSSTTTIKDVYDQLIIDFGGQIASGDYGIHYNNEYIIITGFGMNPTPVVSAQFTVTTIVSAQRDLSIIGWTQLEEEIILLSTSRINTSENPSNTAGQIWRVEIDEETEEPIGLSAGSLVAATHLVYNQILNFSLAHEIERETIAKKESSIKGNVYWTDGYNPPRVINIYNPQSFAIDPSLLDWTPSVDHSIPIIQDIIEGGTNRVGRYQFAYRYISNDGAVSTFSPVSNLVNLTDSTATEPYQDFDGAEAGTESGKSIRFKITNLDRLFDFLEVAVVIYEVKDVPLVYKFAEIPIDGDEINIVYTGNEPKSPITLSEFVNPNTSFKTIKTFTQKKERLYPANTTTESFEVDIDTRAYRFKSLQTTTQLFKRDGTSDTLNGTTFEIGGNPVPDEHDAVNAYNDESGTVFGSIGAVNWTVNHQYKYQYNSTRLGGTGPVISYSFFRKELTGDEVNDTDRSNVPFVYLNPITVTNDNLGITGQDYPTFGPYDNFKSPQMSSVFKGHARGEVYPYGIVFTNSKGQESFVYWIADIRIPEPWEDKDADLSVVDGSNADMLFLNSIGITFTVDTAAVLAADPTITGWYFVRMERKENDKTRHGMGVITGIEAFLDPNADGSRIDLASGGNVDVFMLGTRYGPDAAIPDMLDLNNNFDTNPLIDLNDSKLASYYSPEIDFNRYSIGTAAFAKLLHVYNFKTTRYWAGELPAGNKIVADYRKLQDIDNSPANNYYNINKSTPLTIETIVPSNFSTSLGSRDYHHIFNYKPDAGGTGADHELSGFGTKGLFIEFATDIPTITPPNDQFYLASLGSFNIGQYGGPWRTNRYNRIYISAQSYQPIKVANSPQTTTVFGGDVNMVYYSRVLSFMHWKQDYGYPTATSSGLGQAYEPVAAAMSAVAIVFPCESTVNTEFLYGKYWNKSQVSQFSDDHFGDGINDNDGFARFLVDEYTYNNSYDQENNIKQFISKPFNFTPDESQPNFVWASNRKFDRETKDSWRMYPVNNFIPLEGIYGPINKIVNLKELLFAYQQRAVANVSSEERGAVPDDAGQVFQVGTGDVLSRYDYVSKETGVSHQQAVVVSPSSVFHYDSRLDKMFRLQKGIEPISDLLGLNTFFKRFIKGPIRTNEKILLRSGIHGSYDSKLSKCYFTFLNQIPFKHGDITFSIGNPSTMTINAYEPTYLFDILRKRDIIELNNNIFEVVSITPTKLVVKGDDIVANPTFISLHCTVAFNEFINAFESFYSFTPSLYLPTGKRLFSTNPYDTNNSVWVHNKGDYGVFYGRSPQPSLVEFILNFPDESKLPTFRVDYLEWWSQSIDSNRLDVVLDTLNGIEVYNDYQTTDNSLETLIVGSNVDRMERTWRTNVIRDWTTPSETFKAFLRDKYAKVRLKYNNDNNYKFKLHEFNTNITLSYH